MNIKEIIINGLFNQFDYNIKLKEGGLTILTGPNGYGKTTILNIVNEASRKNMLYFLDLNFKEIRFKFDGNSSLVIQKKDDSLNLSNGFHSDSINRDSVHKSLELFLRDSENIRPFRDGLWLNTETDETFTLDEIPPLIQSEFSDSAKNIKKIGNFFKDFNNTYLIKEQRLFDLGYQPSSIHPKFAIYGRKVPSKPGANIYKYSNQLEQLLKEKLASFAELTQRLDSTYPDRLFDENTGISEKDYQDELETINKTQQLLSKYGLAKPTQFKGYQEENSRALKLYLSDTKEKIKEFDDILNKLETFTSILNEKKFANKAISIHPNFGIKFTTDDSQELKLTDLSSGEQNEVVLLYNLIFKVEANSLILIDEPEISLHVAWQNRFLSDLDSIIKLNSIHAIVATHSPDIINDRFNDLIDLYDINKGEK
jgi:predicted ATP-binding protein involved in virulence